jgi:cell wall-associated NlpC family hydrolase
MAEVVHIEQSPEHADVLKNAKQGDMIQFIRGLYSHWAIYVGNGYVIHRWGEHDGIGKSVGFWGNILTFSGTQFDKATILQSKMTDVIRLGGEVKVNNYLDHKYK